MSYRQRKHRRQRRRSRNGLFLTVGLVGGVLGLAVLGVVGYIVGVAASADIDELEPIDKGRSSEVFAADGSRLGYVQSDEIRTVLPWKDMNQQVRDATVAIEDSASTSTRAWITARSSGQRCATSSRARR